MNKQEKINRLIQSGWETTYHPEYWCHPKTVENSLLQDYTSYGMSSDNAIAFELFDLAPFKLQEGSPSLAIRKRFENNEKNYKNYISNYTNASISTR